MAAQIADLPSSLLMEILSRLPLKSLLICRCVCKNWLLLFKDHFFVKLQLAKSPNWIVRSGYSLDEETSEVKILCFVDEEESIDGGGGGCRIETAVIDLPAHPYRCFNSCNGLLCVEAEGPCGEILVGNPILREWITIHPPPDESSMYAFGFSPKSNEYKVLSFQGRSPGQCASSIYTLGTGLWRILEGTRPLSLGFALNAFMNGSLHWISDCSKPSRFISYFDFDSERFGSLALPPHTYHHRCTVELSVLNGRLSATIDDSDEFVKIWSMMEYGSEESWTVMHTIEYRTPSVVSGHISPYSAENLSWDDDDMSTVLSLNENEVLIACGYDQVLACFNTKTGRCRIPERRQYGTELSGLTAYNPSFVSLCDVAMVERKVVVRPR